MNLVEILHDRAASQPDARAIVDLGGAARRSRTATFAELNTAVVHASEVLRESGLGPGTTALLFMPMSVDLYVALLAVLHRGMTAMFLDPSAGLASVRTGCRRCPPDALVGTLKAHLLGLLAPELRAVSKRFKMGCSLPGMRSLTAGDATAASPTPVSCPEGTPAILTFTSGSTAQAKGVLRTHGFLLAQYRALEATLALEPGQVDLTTLPLFLLANLAAGVTSVIPDVDLRRPGAVSPDSLVAALRAHGVTRTAGSPALLERLGDHGLKQGVALPMLRRIFTGGAPVFPRVLEKLQRIAPEARVAAVYGSSEAEPIAHLDGARMARGDLDAMYAGEGLLAGEPVPEIRLRILEDRWGWSVASLDREGLDRLTVPHGMPGEIVVNGDHVLKGYLDGRGDGETKIRVRDDVWHRTGDAGYLDERGRLWLLGRCGSQVAGPSGTCFPFAVECAASRFPFVRRSAFFEDPGGGRVLAVEARESDPPLEELEAALSWAELSAVRVVREIPVNARHNAKIDYTKLKRALSP